MESEEVKEKVKEQINNIDAKQTEENVKKQTKVEKN